MEPEGETNHPVAAIKPGLSGTLLTYWDFGEHSGVPVGEPPSAVFAREVSLIQVEAPCSLCSQLLSREQSN
jgi:hypothetical protein